MKFSIILTVFGLNSLCLALPDFISKNDFSNLPGFSSPVEGFSLNLNELRLVQFGENEAPKWVTELDKVKAKAQGKKFFDITETPDLASYTSKTVSPRSFPAPNASHLVNSVIATLSTEGPQANLETFSSFRTRHYRSDTGKQSQKWLLGKVSEITDEFSTTYGQSLIDISEFSHSWGQNTIIAKIKGSASTGVVIISAHQDSTGFWPFMPAPGADDDGSGTVTILETYRALLAANFTPTNDVEFHWYSAEEGGLLGSQAVARDYAHRDVPVLSQIQFDMTAFVKRGTREEIGVVTDYTEPGLTTLVKQLIDAYLDIPYAETTCGYACSDHASWYKIGVPVAFPFEAQFKNDNPYIHSQNDRIDISDEFSFSHMLEFSKLAVAYIIEVAGWKV